MSDGTEGEQGGASERTPESALPRAEVDRLATEREAARAKLIADAEALNTPPPPAEQPMEPLNLPPTDTGNTNSETGEWEPTQPYQAPDTADVHSATGVAPTPDNVVPFTPPADKSRKKTRAEVAAMRETEKTTGVDYYLPITDEWVIVRDLPFADRVILTGIPHELRGEIDAALQDDVVRKVATQGVNALEGVVQMAGLFEKAEALVNGVCIAAFIKPRLVLHERELEPGNEDIWLVTDVHMDERTLFFGWVQRNRALANSAGGATTVGGAFPGAGVGSPTDRADSNPVPQTTG